MNPLWPVYSSTASETFDVPTSRFLMQCNDLTMNTQALDENYGPEIAEFYPTYIVPNSLMISTNFVTHETNTTTISSPSSSDRKNNLLATIHSPTPSLVTDDEQESQQTPFLYHDFQVQIANETFNNQQQQPSPDIRDNYAKGSSAITNFQLKKLSPDLRDNLQNVPTQQPPSPVSLDGNGLGIVQITPPPSHQTTPRQKKRRVSRKLSLNSTNMVAENQQTQPSDIFATINTRDSTNHDYEYDFCSDGRNSYAFPSSASSSRRNSVSGKRRAVDDPDETPEERRRKFLERNRIAASKCRQKKKAAMQELKERADTISTRNASLHAFVNDLREELLTLKNQLLAHRNCNCNILQEYIKKDAHANTPTTTTVTQKN